MNTTFSRAGLLELKWVYGIALAGLGVAGFIVLCSYYYLQQEKLNETTSQKQLAELKNRVETVKREREDLRASSEAFKTILAQGVFYPEQRLDLIDTLTTLGARHRLSRFEYDVQPQRLLRTADERSFPAIDIRASRVRMKFRNHHDGDLLAFLEEFPRLRRGFFPIEDCTIRRLPDAVQSVYAVAAEPTLESECTFDWITIRDKRDDMPSMVAPNQAIK